MKKTIIVIAVLVIIACVILCACSNKKGGDENTNGEGESATIEIFTDPDSGEMYVTNKDGEHIPVTTGLNNEMEFVEDLVTKTEKQVSQEAESISQAKETQTEKGSTPATTKTTDTTQQGQTTTESSGGMEIGDGDPLDEDNAAVINWG